MGLRGTGSIDYNIDGAFVPEEYSHFAFTERAQARRRAVQDRHHRLRRDLPLGLGDRRRDGGCSTSWPSWCAARPAVPARRSTAMRFQHKFAETEAKYRAARALVYEAWTDATETIGRGEALSLRQNTLIRLALGHITSTLLEVAN